MPAHPKRRVSRPLILALSGLLALVPLTADALTIVAHQEHFDAERRVFEFSVTFSAEPDLFTIDQVGREKDAIQYWINWGLFPNDPYHTLFESDVVIAVRELRTLGQIPVRDRTGPGEPGPGGWGPIRGLVPYTLVGPTIRFEVPAAMLGDDDGVVSYYLMMLTYGGWTDYRAGISDQPDPPVHTAKSTWGRIKALQQ